MYFSRHESQTSHTAENRDSEEQGGGLYLSFLMMLSIHVVVRFGASAIPCGSEGGDAGIEKAQRIDVKISTPCMV